MSFPDTGYSALATAGRWTWKTPPLKAAPEAGFTKVTAKIAIRRMAQTAMPPWTKPGALLAATSFTGELSVPLPDGDFYCTGAVITESPKHEHEIYDVSWIGFAPGQGRDTSKLNIIFPAISSGKIIVESYTPSMARFSQEFPQNGSGPGDAGVIYAEAGLVGGAANVINDQTGEYQRTELALKQYKRRYTGKAICLDDFLPEPRCSAPTVGAEAPDTDGGIDLAGNGSGEQRIRRRKWWPGKTTAAAWLLNSFDANLVDAHGEVMLFEWSADFDLVREWDW